MQIFVSLVFLEPILHGSWGMERWLSLSLSTYICVHMYVCVCVCVCVQAGVETCGSWCVV